MKKLLCAAVIAATLLCLLPTFGCAGTAEVKYKLSEDGAYYIVSGVEGDKRSLTAYDVPSTYSLGEGEKSLPVKEIGDEAFYGCSSLVDVTLPDGIERIGNLAFALCAFYDFTIPDSVTEIGWSAFGMCESLTEIVVPESVTKLGDRAFFCCSALERAVVLAQITDLDSKTFYASVATQGGNVYTSSVLKEIYLPATLQKINFNALYGNTALTDIYFMGTEEQWNALYFYENVKKEGTENEYEENKLKKTEVLSEGITVHYNSKYTPAAD